MSKHQMQFFKKTMKEQNGADWSRGKETATNAFRAQPRVKCGRFVELHVTLASVRLKNLETTQDF